MYYYNQPINDLLKLLKTDPVNGLTPSQAADKLSLFGENKLKEKKKKSYFMRFADQLKDVMILILIAAAVVSFIMSLYSDDSNELFEPLLIIFIVVLNAFMGMIQESKAERSLEALKKLSAPHARVIRGGKEEIIDAADLVPGDIIKLEAGDFVPADARLLHSSSLRSEEAILTGESVSSEKNALAEVNKTAGIGDRVNTVFSGCSITYGTASAVVAATGMETEIGKIAGLLVSEADTRTPLQNKLAQLGKSLGLIALFACGVIFILGLIDKIPIMDIFMTSVSLAVSSIPEGLPVIVTIVLSIGVQRMVKKNAIIRSLPAVETLGSASVICSDKTGTLTQNRMTLTRMFAEGSDTINDFASGCDSRCDHLLLYASLCCNASVITSGGSVQLIGDPTEAAIVYAAYKRGFKTDEINEKYPRLTELPFDSDRKLMTTVNNIDGRLTVIVKGAFEAVALRCVSGNIEKASEINRSMSSSALRVLAVGCREIDLLPAASSCDNLENGLRFMGLVGMIDPPRPEAAEAVRACIKAGIKPVMITGDHVTTASAIAASIGILKDGDSAVTGSELDKMNDEEFFKKLPGISVYARISPQNKIRIVKAWQQKGAVVAMTGDGVNDAPALKAADIGCAMGITGTDVAKSASDMTLTDDNFATIVEAVREGRGIYANIKKVVGFLLGTNTGEILTVFFSMLLWRQTPLLSMQLLWINLVTDSFPAVALGMEKIENDVMEQRPKPKSEGIFAGKLWLKILLQGFMFALLTLIGYRIGYNSAGSVIAGRTVAFMVLSLIQIFHSYNMRSERSIFRIGVFSNRNLNIAAVVSIILVVLVLFTPVSVIFKFTYLSADLYITGLLLALAPVAIMESLKLIIACIHKKRTLKGN